MKLHPFHDDRPVALTLLRMGLTIYLLLGFVLWAGQELMLFPAVVLHANRDATAPPAGVDLVTLPSGTPLWLHGRHDRVVLLLHGNGEWVGQVAPSYAARLDVLGWSLAALELRGVAGAPGWPTEAALTHDIALAFEALESRGWPADRVVLHGRSIGGGVAGTSLDRVQPAALVLESSFDSLLATAGGTFPAGLYPLSWMMRSPLASATVLDANPVPTLQLHAARDTVVPLSRAQALHDKVGFSTLYIVDEDLPHGTPLALVHDGASSLWARWIDDRVPPTTASP